MRIMREQDLEWMVGPARHRTGTLAFKRLAWGVENTPENYLLVLAKTDGDYHTPRHRHNFDQIRFSLEGKMSVAPRSFLTAGEIAYFPEGAYYGPQVDTGAFRLGLTLQFGGASGQGYISWEQMDQGRKALAGQGEFKDGVFRRAAGAGKKNQDGFEAIWEAVCGRKLVYPKPRYRAPVMVEPEAFDWRKVGPGIETKQLGMFTERGVRMEMTRIDKGARLSVAAEPAIRLLFVMDGAATCGGTEIGKHSVVDVSPNERAEIAATAETQVFTMVLPLLNQESIARAA